MQLITQTTPDHTNHTSQHHLSAQIGDYFSRFGEVLDVEVMPDIGKVLEICTKATALEHKKQLLIDEIEDCTGKINKNAGIRSSC